ncbi:MAG: tryptophan--tRNA ligase [Cellvibrionales bacterium]|nr:tryptophan--tRNA ligase [Porticoccaceae bacterium]|tara:strand:- start:25551 stop:26561 length:1011 start_codon:yes stop_codon:yes gene_type:complete
MSIKHRVLTGITTSGSPHLGNYVGAIRPAIVASQSADHESFFFLADYHALIKAQDPERLHQSTKEIAAAWLALGLDTRKAVFYRQSDIPEIPQLTWLLTCMTAKGLMNRAHAYKGSVADNVAAGEDGDYAINMGLFSYPILMAADILMFNAQTIPVGRDQIQHVEMARDIAQRFNHRYGELFQLPAAQVDDNVAILQGLDGRKMSKSYGNTIPLFLAEKQLKKHINKIVTNLLEPGEPKDAETSTVFQIWRAFANEKQTAEMRVRFAEGIGWGEAKKELYELLNEQLREPRERYNELLQDPARVENALAEGAEKARVESSELMRQLRDAVGIKALA